VRSGLSGTFSVWDKPAALAGLEFAPGYYQKNSRLKTGCIFMKP